MTLWVAMPSWVFLQTSNSYELDSLKKRGGKPPRFFIIWKNEWRESSQNSHREKKTTKPVKIYPEQPTYFHSSYIA